MATFHGITSCKATKLWENIENISPRGGAAIVAVNDMLLLFGGANREQEHFGDVHILHKIDDQPHHQWKTIETSGDVPPPRSGHAMCVYRQHVLLFGGMAFENDEGAIYNDLYTLDTVTWEWKYVGEAGEEITPRNSHALHVITTPCSSGGGGLDSYLVMFGGASPELGPLGDTYYALLPAAGISDTSEFYVTWQRLQSSAATPSPSPREMFSASTLPTSPPGCSALIIAGGRGLDMVLSDMWILHHHGSDIACEYTSPFAWKRLPAMELPHPRCAHTSACIPSTGVLLVYGGFTGLGIAEDVISADLQGNVADAAGGWRVVETSAHIGGRFGHCMNSTTSPMSTGSEDASIDGVLIFGGIDATNDYNDMWALTQFA